MDSSGSRCLHHDGKDSWNWENLEEEKRKWSDH